MSIFRYDLGAKAKDRVTGYTGIIVARMEWLYGCRRYAIQSQEMKDGKPVDALYFDEDAVVILEEAPPREVANRGGPQNDPPRSAGPAR